MQLLKKKKVLCWEFPGNPGLGAFTAVGAGSVLGLGTKIPQAMWCDQKKKMFFV